MAAPLNPKGAKSDKIWRDAILRAVRRLETDPQPKTAKPEQRLELLADALVCKALLGDVPGLKEIGDRLDGKAVQATEISGPDGAPIETASSLDVTGLSVEQLKALASIKV